LLNESDCFVNLQEGKTEGRVGPDHILILDNKITTFCYYVK
jgi:hypothetical protein